MLAAGTVVATVFAVDARRKEAWALEEKGRADGEARRANDSAGRATVSTEAARQAHRSLGLMSAAEGPRLADEGRPRPSRGRFRHSG